MGKYCEQPNKILTEEKVIAMRVSNDCAFVLSKRYGVSIRTVQDILLGVTWKNLTPSRRETIKPRFSVKKCCFDNYKKVGELRKELKYDE